MGKLLMIPGCLGCFAVSVFLCVSLSAVGIMLRSLYVFTAETVVAEVEMSPIQSDEGGEYINIAFTPYLQEDALSVAFNSSASDSSVLHQGATRNYKIYGDTVAIRGPLIKLYDTLLFLNYHNIYKLALIEGEYRRNNNPEGRTGTEEPLNDGFDSQWWFVNENEAQYPYSLIVHRFTFSGSEEPGFYGNQRKRYEIVVTRDTITWNLKSIIEDTGG